MFSTKELQAIGQFLSRTDIRGNEAPMMVLLLQKIQVALRAESKEPEAPEANVSSTEPAL